eukprot:gene26840-30338_t
MAIRSATSSNSVSSSPADPASCQVGFHNAVYHWPTFAGDTFKKRFVIRKLCTTSDDKRPDVTIHCQLSNQRDVLVISFEKTMMFPFRASALQLLLHTLSGPLSLTHSMQLASLVCLTHGGHFDTLMYPADQLLVWCWA